MHNRVATLWRALLAALLVLAVAGGCATPIAGSTVQVTLTPSGTLAFQGREMDAAHLARVLKAEGADASTTIRIAIPEGTSRQVLSKIAGELMSAGFRRVLFTKPRHAAAEVDNSGIPVVTPAP